MHDNFGAGQRRSDGPVSGEDVAEFLEGAAPRFDEEEVDDDEFEDVPEDEEEVVLFFFCFF